MTAAQLQALLDDSNCDFCYAGASVVQLIKLALLDRVSKLYPAFSFIQRAGITDATQIAAINELVLSAKRNGWWDKCDLIYPFVGGTALAHSQNLKSTNFTITWNGVVTHNANGITGDGATGYGDTGYNASLSSIWGLNSGHVSVYRRTFGGLAGVRCLFGVHGPPSYGIGMNVGGAEIFGRINQSLSGALNYAGSALLGLVAISRLDAASNRGLFSVGEIVQVGASSSIQSASPVVLARRSTPSTFLQFTDANVAGVTVGSGITFSEYQTMSSDWQTFQTALGRQV